MATHIIIAIGVWALVIVGICRWFYLNSDRRHPLHDLSDKQADFASLDIRDTFHGVVIDGDEATLRKMFPDHANHISEKAL
jgi:hypothetical protein